MEPSTYSPLTPRDLTDSAACISLLSCSPRTIITISSLENATPYALADCLRSSQVVLLAGRRGLDYREAGLLYCLLGAIVLNGGDDTRVSLVRVLNRTEGKGEDEFWEKGMIYFHFTGDMFGTTTQEVMDKMQRCIEFLSIDEYMSRDKEEAVLAQWM